MQQCLFFGKAISIFKLHMCRFSKGYESEIGPCGKILWKFVSNLKWSKKIWNNLWWIPHRFVFKWKIRKNILSILFSFKIKLIFSSNFHGNVEYVIHYNFFIYTFGLFTLMLMVWSFEWKHFRFLLSFVNCCILQLAQPTCLNFLLDISICTHQSKE